MIRLISHRKTFRTLAIACATLLVGLAGLTGAVSPASAAAPTISGYVQGASPFIAMVRVTNVPLSKVSNVSFGVQARPGTVSQAIGANYTLSYLTAHNYVDAPNSAVTVPVYGLYDGFANTVSLRLTGPRSYSQNLTATVTTTTWVAASRPGYADPQYSDRQAIVPRDANIKLGYSFFMLKTWTSGATPVVMDTDGYVRWVGTDGNGDIGSTFVGNDFYVGAGNKMRRIGLDGVVTTAADLSATSFFNFHHNVDPGRDGLLLELDRADRIESDIIEVNLQGRILRKWDMVKIFADAMVAGGDNPAGFVDISKDWFHNNSSTYWKAKDQLVISSRENFVAGVDYNTGKLKWLLGDPNKLWHQYSSLAALALTVPAGGTYPIGQHALSFTTDGQLMLFDNGLSSWWHSPAGDDHSGAAKPRRYKLDLRAKTATETWSFTHAGDIYSPICSSVYQSGASYLIDYASDNWGQVRLVGIDSADRVAFEYVIPGADQTRGWNALPIHIEALSYK